MTFNNVYFLLKDQDGNKIVKKKFIDDELLFAKAVTVPETAMQTNLYDKVQKWYNIYKGCYLEFNGIHIGHGPFVSHFSLSERKMVKMTQFPCEVHRVFETVENTGVARYMTFGVILENGDVYDAMRDDPTNPDIKIKEKTEPDYTLSGKKILWSHMDKREGDYYYVAMEEENGEVTIYNITDGDHGSIDGFTGITEETRLVYVITQGQHAFITQTGDTVILWDSSSYYSTEEICRWNVELSEENQHDYVLAAFGDEDEDNLIYLFTTKGVYKVNKEDPSEIKLVTSKVFVNGICIEGKYLYAAQHEDNLGTDSNLNLVDFKTLVQNDKIVSYHLKNMSFGPNGMMEYNFRNERIAILDSHSRFMVFPLLHRNVIVPAGLPQTFTMLS